MKELSPREVQLGELSVLKGFADVCQKLNLSWFMMYGTLLGAVRHKGFIPWDDDIDVCMPRPDYDRLIEYLIEEPDTIKPLKLMNYQSNKDYIYPISRLCDTRYQVDYADALDYGLGLFIDIYPFDGAGNTQDEFNSITKKFRRDILLAGLAGDTSFKKSYSGWWRTPIKLAMYCYAKLIGSTYFARKLDHKAQQFKYEDNLNVSLLVWDDQSEPYLREWFSEVIPMEFEGELFPAPKGYHEILKSLYGNYMELPPEEERVGHHYYTAYLKDENVMSPVKE